MSRKHQVEGERARRAVIDFMADAITSPDSPLTNETLDELRACWLYFPEGKQLVDRIEAIYSDKPELRKAVYSPQSLPYSSGCCDL